MRSVHRDAADGRMRPAAQMSGVRKESAAGVSDRALLCDNVGGAATRAGDQRAKRIGAKSLLQSRRRLQLLLRQFDALQKERQREPRWRERLSLAPAMDDLALTLEADGRITSNRVSGGLVRLVLADWPDNMELIPFR